MLGSVKLWMLYGQREILCRELYINRKEGAIMAIPTNIKTLLSDDVVKWARIEFKGTWDPAASLKSVCAFANDLDN